MRDSGRLIVLCLLIAATALTQTTTPVITSLNPTSIVAGSPTFTLQVNGANFVTGTQVRVNNSFRTTQFVSSTRVNVTIPASDLTTPRILSITAVNPGSAISAAVNFTVVSNIPAIASISPSSAAVGSGALRSRRSSRHRR
jgi:trimeric autotransporter adhesin